MSLIHRNDLAGAPAEIYMRRNISDGSFIPKAYFTAADARRARYGGEIVKFTLTPAGTIPQKKQ